MGDEIKGSSFLPINTKKEEVISQKLENEDKQKNPVPDKMELEQTPEKNVESISKEEPQKLSEPSIKKPEQSTNQSQNINQLNQVSKESQMPKKQEKEEKAATNTTKENKKEAIEKSCGETRSHSLAEIKALEEKQVQEQKAKKEAAKKEKQEKEVAQKVAQEQKEKAMLANGGNLQIPSIIQNEDQTPKQEKTEKKEENTQNKPPAKTKPSETPQNGLKQEEKATQKDVNNEKSDKTKNNAEKDKKPSLLSGIISPFKKKGKDDKRTTKEMAEEAKKNVKDNLEEKKKTLQPKVVKKDQVDGKGTVKKKKTLNRNAIIATAVGALVLVLALNNIFGGRATPTEDEFLSDGSSDSTFVDDSTVSSEDEENANYTDIEAEEDEPESDLPSSSTFDEEDEWETEGEDEPVTPPSSNSSSGSIDYSSTDTPSGPPPSSSSSSSSSSNSYTPPASTNTSRPTPQPQPPKPSKPVIKPDSTFSVAPNNISVSVGQSMLIKPTKTCYFVSDNSRIAVVEGGKVIGLSQGACTITATSTNGETFAIKVTVK